MTVRDRVALVLALGAGLSVAFLSVAALIVAVADPTSDMSPDFASVITGTLGVMIGALAGYLGNRPQQEGDRHDER